MRAGEMKDSGTLGGNATQISDVLVSLKKDHLFFFSLEVCSLTLLISKKL